MAKDIEIVKKGYSKDRFTNAQYLELAKCMADPIYFCENYVMVQHPIKGRVPFELYDFQRKIIRNFHENRYCIALTARQMGKTTTAAGFLLWKAMFEPDTTILIAANKYNQALEIMDRIRFAYENLEQVNWLRAGVTEYNKGTITFDNGSKIVSRATAKDSGRGLSITLLYVDEFAFVAPNKAAEFWSAIQPTLATGGACIITSTPNHDEDQFATIWHGANTFTDQFGNEIPGGIGANNFKPIKVKWDEHPDRDDAWADTQRAQLGDAIFRRENECEFISFEETLINPITLSNLRPSDPIMKIGEIRWFEEPQPNHIYSIGWDPCMGTGGDFAAIQVFELTSMRQVAEWKDHNTKIPGQVQTLLRILYYLYQTMANNPEQTVEPEIYWTVENNGMGEAALVAIDEIGEENFPGVFVHEPKRAGQSMRGRKGMNTSQRTKMTACSRLKSLVESQRMQIRSRALITELKNFIQGGGSYNSRHGNHDDLISATLLVLRILQTIANWDEGLGEMLKESGADDAYETAPMPIVV